MFPDRFEPPKIVSTLLFTTTFVLVVTEVLSPPPYTVFIVPPFIKTFVVPVVPPALFPPYKVSQVPPEYVLR